MYNYIGMYNDEWSNLVSQPLTFVRLSISQDSKFITRLAIIHIDDFVRYVVLAAIYVTFKFGLRVS